MNRLTDHQIRSRAEHQRELRARRAAANKALRARPIENDDHYDDIAALLAEHEVTSAQLAHFGRTVAGEIDEPCVTRNAAGCADITTDGEQLRLLPDEAPGYVDPSTVERGNKGESIATKFLIERGYRIIERNFRGKLGELDVIAFDKDVLCFIEVRTRATAEFGHAAETVNSRKRAKVSRAALLYLIARRPHFECARFDVVAITGDVIDLVRDAWRLGDRM